MRAERYLAAVEALEEHNAEPPTAQHVADAIHGCASPGQRKVTQQALKRAEDAGLVTSMITIVCGKKSPSWVKTYSITELGEERLDEPEWE